MTIKTYIKKLNEHFQTGISTEHTYRSDLQNLISDIVKDVLVTNEPSRIACGAPDFIITKKDIPVGYIEAKDIGADLNNNLYKEQFDRYKNSLNNLIITDYLSFQLFHDGVIVCIISLGNIEEDKIIPLYGNFNAFNNLITDFCAYKGQTISSASKLSKMMAAKARLLVNIIENALADYDKNSDSQDDVSANNTLHDQLNSFKQILIHDITPKDFADIYSQTIAYGMFAARLHGSALNNFTRQQAAELIPKSNPFLRKLFQYIAGYDLDDRIKWVVDALADIFNATDVSELLKDFGKSNHQHDPMIHFYETFLTEYDPALRKSRGVWYTPEPVVNFIVRAVDDILRDEFDLPKGLADYSKTIIRVKTQNTDNRIINKTSKFEQEVHKVQILDPACGTGTFLAEVVRQIHNKFEGQQGIWSDYVEKHLIPRLNGFEILMASYAMAHLKLDLLLRETGYQPKKEQRFRIYLTNSLEEEHPDTGNLWANWLSAEANEANYIKRDTPVMVVLGNPPYSVSSSNKSEWVEELMKDYKKDLNERNIQPLSNDYIKFIRFGQHFIEKNGSGILAFISNNSFIDGIIHRQMRKNLLESFDKIYILDLHGNSKKKEICPDGSKDQNVFDIMQGVSINIFVKTGQKKQNELGEVFHSNIYGKRELKYEILLNNSLKTISWENLEINKPAYFFIKKDFKNKFSYDEGFSASQIFKINSVGVVTSCDNIVLADNIETLKSQINNNFKSETFDISFVKNYLYRTFETKKIYYKTGLLGRSRENVMKHFYEPNLGLIISKQFGGHRNFICFLTNSINDKSSQPFAPYYTHPLYFYPEKQKSDSTLSFHESSETYGDNKFERDLFSMTEEPKFAYQSLPYRPNLSQRILRGIETSLGISFAIQQFKNDNNEFGEVDILDYIYAVLHSPTYREKYKEFLKIDFPRVPYPKEQNTFWQLVKFGGELRQIHLLESPVINNFITTYPVSGTNQVDKIKYENNKVWINSTQFFDAVPKIAWNLYIGGYQPAQKWLKDRKGRVLAFDDIQHYQKIIVALYETDRLMKEIDKVEIE